MKKYILLFVVTVLATTQSYSQCACSAGAGAGSSNGDYNNGILTLLKKQWVTEMYGDYRTISHGGGHSHDVSHSAGETPLESMFISSLGVRYGLGNNITISALLPYVFLQTSQGNDKGIGDLILLGTFNILPKTNFKLALQAGVELPTGIQKKANFDNATMVIGSGSIDPMVGFIFSNSWDKLTVQGNGLYKYTTNGFENNNYGSVSTQNLTLAYPIKGVNAFCSTDSVNCNKPSEFGLTVFGGYYGEWLDKIKENNAFDNNSGYYLGFATLGYTISLGNWRFPLTASLPIVQQMNGTQNHAGYRLRVGVIKSF